MATRLYLSNQDVPTTIVPGFAAWQETDGATRNYMFPYTVNGDTLADGTLQASTAGNTQLHRQYISEPMVAGLGFTTSTTFTCQIMGRESAANDNIINRVRCLKVHGGADGTTVRATLIALGNATSVVEWSNSMRNLTFLSATASAANYTTVAGDRLVIEVGHDDVGASVAGQMRFGADPAGSGDLGTNETDTTTTLRPWLESSLDLVWERSPVIVTVQQSIHRSFSY